MTSKDRIIKVALPENFDAREKWPNCIHRVRHQSGCGSCWTYSAAGVLSDRFCIKSNGTINIELSPNDLVSCDDFNKGCNGGTIEVFRTAENQGIALDSCKPYQAARGWEVPCTNKCINNNQAFFRYRAVKNTTTTYKDEMSIKEALFNDGPLWVAFKVEEDFYQYSGGIYSPTSISQQYSGHAVKLVGWGVENGIKYWTIQNSWGPDWGENGFFRIQMGVCQVDTQITAAQPDLTWLPKSSPSASDNSYINFDDWDEEEDDLSK